MTLLVKSLCLRKTITKDLVNSYDKIIINRSDAIGDLVLTLPMAVWIKRHFPHAKVGLIVRKGNLPIASLCDSVDEVFEVKQKASLLTSILSFRKIFREFNPDVYVEVNGNKWGSLSASIFALGAVMDSSIN